MLIYILCHGCGHTKWIHHIFIWDFHGCNSTKMSSFSCLGMREGVKVRLSSTFKTDFTVYRKNTLLSKNANVQAHISFQ